MSDAPVVQLKSLSARHRELCRLCVRGATNKEIMERLGYSESRVSVLKSDPLIQSEIERLEDRLFEENLSSRLKGLGPAAIGVLEQILLSDDPTIKMHVKREAAIWVMEKLSGKPKSEVNIESNSLNSYMELLREMQQQGAAIDVPPLLPTLIPADSEEIRIDKYKEFAESL